MNFEQTPEFKKELKKFAKKWRSLPSDLKTMQKVVETLYKGANGLTTEQIREAFFRTKKGAVLTQPNENSEVVKLRLDCADLNKDMLRVTFYQTGDTIVLIEIFAKNDKPREDRQRIQKYIK